MSFRPFRKIRVSPNSTITSKNINDVQDNISEAIQQVLGKDELDQVLLTNINLIAGVTNKIPHKLGRTLQGYWVVRTHSGFAQIADLQDTNPSPNLLLYLIAAAPCTVDLLVF